MNFKESTVIDKPTDKSNVTDKPDTWRSIMKDLYELGKSTNNDAIIQQAVLGTCILNEKDKNSSE